jgi:hypothetical protein
MEFIAELIFGFIFELIFEGLAHLLGEFLFDWDLVELILRFFHWFRMFQLRFRP